MYELITKICPPSLLAGIVLYGLACALWFQPLVERRLATKTMIPQCETIMRNTLTNDNRAMRHEYNRQRAALDVYRRLTGNLSDIPFMDTINDLVEDLAPPELPPIAVPNEIDTSTVCGCAVAGAFDAIRFPMLLHVMRLRAYQPAALQTLPHVAAGLARSGQCGHAS
ncbi:hypothetical protein [Rhizobium sp. RU36D]|uniref:hypothetical protein n=1 Tax=Rhizobium sp. RU36D TaxID=1907415 RepID=UPI0009D82A6F|nr:hypothetical protein [Rhizobium sp. RU36D]SMD14984.1 hypothetical protein SAMN05880593_1279 [Rhizobium sp. RU36D]